MDLATLEMLLSPVGTAALAAATELAPTDAKYPACLDRLRKQFPDAVGRAALDTVMLRERARGKFARAATMIFDREALEMSSGEAVAVHRAGRFAGFPTVADLCCGIGGDAIGLALAGRAVTCVDRDPVRLRMAEANLAAYGFRGTFLTRDVLADPLPDVTAAFVDPGRRPGGRRVLAVSDYEPSLDAVLARLPAGFPLAAKVAPGVPRDDLRRLPAEAEFVSFAGELKECVLWFGPLRRATVTATVLPGPHTLTATGPPPSADLGPVGRFVYDPDPAVTRSELVGVLAARLGAVQFEPNIAFLTADALAEPPTPFASAYRVEDVLPFHVKRVGEWLRSRSVGRVTIVKRGSTADADELVKRWKLRGDGHREVLLTRAGGEPVAIIAERVSP
ncbi:MAG: class I SAM-dependent methyltransferase [Fimbriiglobus sp.]